MIVDIQLENCEVFSFKEEDVLRLEFQGIKKYLCFGKMRTKAKHTLIVIDKNAKPKTEGWQDENWLSRIRRVPDITHIYIGKEAYTVDWNPKLEEINLNQRLYESEEFGEKDIVIIISPTKRTEADFD